MATLNRERLIDAVSGLAIPDAPGGHGRLGERKAQQILEAMLDSMVAALQRHETVELPFGTLRVVPHRIPSYRRWFRGQPVEFYRNPYQVVFEPKESSRG